MPKVAVPRKTRVRAYITEFNCFKEKEGELYCKYCAKTISYDQRSQVTAHINGQKHIQLVKRCQEQLMLQEVGPSPKTQGFAFDLAEFMTKNDIPLHKVRDESFTKIFAKYTTEHIPCETTLRNVYVPMLEKKTLDNIKEMVKNEYMWIQIDETQDNQKRCVVNVVMGILSSDEEKSRCRFLLHVSMQKKANADTILRVYQEAVE